MSTETLCKNTNMTASQCQCGDPEAHYGYARVRPEPETRLAQLRALYDGAKAEFDAAKETFEGVKDGIKAEMLGQVASGTTRVLLAADGTAPLQLTYSESWRIDSKKLKAEDPLTYVRFAKKSPSWTLREAQ